MLKNYFQPTKAQQYHKQFWRDGYLLLRNFFSVRESNNIKKIANELETFPEQEGKWMIYFEKNGHQNKKRARIENIINYHPELKEIVDYKITPTLEYVYQKPMNLFKDKMNWKKPFGQGFRAHQDQPAWNDFPPERFVSAAIFGDKTTIKNGCLEFSPKNHINGILDSKENLPGELTKEKEETLMWEAIETTSQDLLIFDSFAPHRSKSNKTDSSRRIFYFTYNCVEEGDFYQEYIKKKREFLPPDIERVEGKKYEILGTKYNLANPIE